MTPGDTIKFLRGVSELPLEVFATLCGDLESNDPRALEIYSAILGIEIRQAQTRTHYAIEIPARLLRPGMRTWKRKLDDGPSGPLVKIVRVDCGTRYVTYSSDRKSKRVHVECGVWIETGRIPPKRKHPPFRAICGGSAGTPATTGHLRVI